MNRRQFFKLGASLGALAGAGAYAGSRLLPPDPSPDLGSIQDLASRLVAGLDPELRRRACVEYDHPLRQYHNRGVGGGGLAVERRDFDPGQRQLLVDLFHAGLSAAGRGRVARQFFLGWPGVYATRLLICGDPRRPPYQVIFTGPHLNLRLGGASREGVAFGGPQVYGDQRGDGVPGVSRNVYRYQFEAGQRLFRSLRAEEQRAALLPVAPIQTRIELQGPGGRFPGVPLAGVAPGSLALARALVEGILENYPADDVAYARRCLERNGGLAALHLSYYEEGADAGRSEYPIFRLEGPAAVFHFRGHPHVHAFAHVAMDAGRPLGVGELLGVNPAPLEGEAVRRLFEDALRHHAGSDFAWYDPDSVVGGLRPGPVRTGDVYVLESWQNRVAVVDVKGSRLREPFVEALRARGAELEPGRTYTIATTDYLADGRGAGVLGAVGSGNAGIPVREAVVAYLKERGFPGGG